LVNEKSFGMVPRALQESVFSLRPHKAGLMKLEHSPNFFHFENIEKSPPKKRKQLKKNHRTSPCHVGGPALIQEIHHPSITAASGRAAP
jgi:hypothetical protein